MKQLIHFFREPVGYEFVGVGNGIIKPINRENGSYRIYIIDGRIIR